MLFVFTPFAALLLPILLVLPVLLVFVLILPLLAALLLVRVLPLFAGTALVIGTLLSKVSMMCPLSRKEASEFWAALEQAAV